MARLTLERIVETACHMADEGGYDSVKLAAIAERLKVKPPSLYRHLGGMDDVLRWIARKGVTALNERLLRATIGLSPTDAIVALARTVWRFSQMHPGLYVAVHRFSFRGDPEIEAEHQVTARVFLSALEGFTLNAEESPNAAYGIRSMIHGFVSLQSFGSLGDQPSAETSLVQLMRLHVAGLACARKHQVRVGPFTIGLR